MQSEAVDRSLEWNLARVGLLLILLGAITIGIRAGIDVFLYLPSLAVLGIVGLYAAIRERDDSSDRWAFLHWLVGGGLLGFNFYGVTAGGGWGGLAPALWAAAVAFFACAWHADRREGRLEKWLPAFITIALVQAILAFGATASVIGWLAGG